MTAHFITSEAAKGQDFLSMASPCAFNTIQVIQGNSDWSNWNCMTFDEHARQAKLSLYGVMVSRPSAIDCMSPVNREYTSYHFFHINYHCSVFFSVIKWFLWPSIPPSISKHPASRPWKTAYPSPEWMISSRIPLLISFASHIPP